MTEILVVLGAYLIGSIPFAFLVSRRSGIDLRRAGSGNIGATNVLRTTGVRAAIAAMMLDAAKGSLAVLVAQPLTGGSGAPVAAGVASILGHVYPVWLKFRGGKGVATAAGVFAVLMPAALGIAAAVFALAVWTTRYISVGSLAAALTLAVAAVVNHEPLMIAAGAGASAALIVSRHRANLSRLIAGTERRIGERVGQLPRGTGAGEPG